MGWPMLHLCYIAVNFVTNLPPSEGNTIILLLQWTELLLFACESYLTFRVAREGCRTWWTGRDLAQRKDAGFRELISSTFRSLQSSTGPIQADRRCAFGVVLLVLCVARVLGEGGWCRVHRNVLILLLSRAYTRVLITGNERPVRCLREHYICQSHPALHCIAFCLLGCVWLSLSLQVTHLHFQVVKYSLCFGSHLHSCDLPCSVHNRSLTLSMITL